MNEHDMTVNRRKMTTTESDSKAMNQINSKHEPRRRSASHPPPEPPMANEHATGMATTMDALSLDDNDSSATAYGKGRPFPPAHDTKLKKNIAHVTFAQLPPEKVAKPADHKGKGNRKDYLLGDTLRSPSHIIQTNDPARAFQLINSLKNHDFAFVKDSGGTYIHAILAVRSLEPPAVDSSINYPETLEECMVFAMSDTGSTLKLRKSEWTERIRLVSLEGEKPNPSKKKSFKQNQDETLELEEEDSGWAPPNVISFVPPKDDSIYSEISSPSLLSDP